MLRRLFISVGIILCTSLLVFSQNGTLKGKIIDKGTKEPIPFANIIVEQGGKQYGGTTSDIDGNYTVRPLPAGKFDVKATYVGYKPLLIKGVVITSNIITFSDISMESTSINIETFEVVDYKIPLISKDQTQSGETVTSEDIAKMPGRSAQAVAATVGGVFSQDGNMGSVRGQREDGTVTYIDGVRVRGSSGLPKSAIEEVGVILGGTPAKYGEATGGILNIVTKGPSREFGGSVEFVTSELTDKYGYNIASFSLNGPLLKSKDPKQPTSLLGFFISGEFQSIRDNSPAAGGDYKVNDEKRIYLEQNPLIFVNQSGGGYQVKYSADYLRKSDFEKFYTKENGASRSINFAGKIDVRTNTNTNLTFGGSFDYNDYSNWSRSNQYLNSVNNGEVTSSTSRVYGKFTQRFPSDKESKSLIKNVFYQLQADYTKYHSVVQDKNHKDNLFNYGYVGKFTTYKAPFYQLGSDTVNGIVYDNVMVLATYYDSLLTFERSELNPTLANYTSQLYSFFGNVYSYQDLLQLKGIRNGDRPSSVYSLITNTGSNFNAYQVVDQQQIGFNANGSADFGNHALEFGLQYEQLIERGYGYSPAGLWTLMRNLANRHIQQLDFNNPILIPGGLVDTIKYNRLYTQSDQAFFDINLRKALGLPVNGTDWIDIDKYSPDLFKTEMFSPDELFNEGSSYVTYYGYDHNGNVVSGKPSFQDFFNNKDENGNYKRIVGAFQPVYMAGYIQDKFAFNDLIFNIGLRIDRFDANQMVLKDPYLFYDSKTIKDVTDPSYTHPGNLSKDAVVYVDSYTSDKPTILGYREGEKWYTKDGTYIEDPYLIKGSSGKPTPWRVNKDQKDLEISAFKDYEPQTTFMPRISFSFPISDEALFFAHYDIITKRPTTGLRMNPIDYLFIDKQGTSIINNPDLKPEKTTDYELGFQQKLSNSSSLKFSAYYREIRNLVQAHKFTGADPNDNYVSYTNVDFGTVKGMTIAYDLRRTSNIRIRASYTMQFADGTGSGPQSQQGLVAAGQPNLRTMSALAYDQRHAIKVDLDFRYESGKKYNGPTITKKIKGTDKVRTIPLLENTGFHLSFNSGSGTPYTKVDIVSKKISGNLSGSRLPWQFWLDATIDRDIFLKFGKDGEKNKKYAYLNVYLEILNVLNTRNILGVYQTTGNPDDDGYLAAAENQKEINSATDPQSYRDIYSLVVANPYNYSLPRRIRIGVVLNF